VVLLNPSKIRVILVRNITTPGQSRNRRNDQFHRRRLDQPSRNSARARRIRRSRRASRRPPNRSTDRPTLRPADDLILITSPPHISPSYSPISNYSPSPPQSPPPFSPSNFDPRAEPPSFPPQTPEEAENLINTLSLEALLEMAGLFDSLPHNLLDAEREE
jgi:hypothetical protein